VPTAPTHALAAVAIGSVFPRTSVPRRLWAAGAVVAMAPDADVIGFRLGIAYGDFWGHRGFTHSLVFAAGLATCAAWICGRGGAGAAGGAIRWLYLFVAAASHGLLDALTDGGLGIALLAPFDNTRYFFPVRPIAVSPIGIASFFTSQGFAALRSEIVWIWVPSSVLMALGAGGARRHRREQ
jgi:inner membrane protein